MSARVVFLGHAADRTGPPMYLLSLLRHLDLSDLDVVVVLLRGGELLDDLRSLVEVRVVGEPVDLVVASPSRAAEEPARVAARRAQLADLHDLDLVVVNTAWSIHALAWLPPGAHRLLSIVHELAAGVDDLLGPAELSRLRASDRFVVGCRAAADLLAEGHGVERGSITLIPYGVEVGGAPGPTPPDRSALDAGSSAFLVVAAAVPDRRKGPDLFVHLAATARRRRPDIAWAFRWIGAAEDQPVLADARLDRSLLGAGDLVGFLPPTPRLRDHLAVADAFVLTSREDAFPLAAAEAALAGLPLLCFATGGITDLIGTDGGAAVAFPDLEAMVGVLSRWHDDPSTRTLTGAAARDRARRHHDVVDHAASFGAVLRQELGGA